MKRFKNILYLADPEGNGNTAFQHAASLAKRNAARIKAVIVLEPPPKSVEKKLRKKHSLDIQKVLVQNYTDKLEKLVAPLKRAGLRTETRVFFGDPFIEVIREILRHQHDLVITAARLHRGMKEVFFGSTAMHLMRKCPSPLWVIKPTRHKTFTHVLAAIDPLIEDDTAHRQKNSLNAKILELASSLSEIWGSKLHIISAWTIYGESHLRGYNGITHEEFLRYRLATKTVHRKALEKLVVEHVPPSVSVQVHSLKGDPGMVIPSFVKNHQVDVIVMGTLCRTGLSGLYIGNTAEKVLGDVRCSVLTVKPEGFVSPVKLP
jgi:nucleotide-binding universal stress UspA family protein